MAPNLTFSPTQGPFDPSQFDVPVWGRSNPWDYARTPLSALDPNDFRMNIPSGEHLLAQDPGYKFRMDQGRQALEASAAARGGLFSGSTGKALQDYAQGLASQEYANAYGRFRGENEMNYQRALTQNMTNEQRAALANEQNYGRLRDYETDLYNRAMTSNATNYGRHYQANQDLFNREALLNNMDWQRATYADETAYGRDYQRSQDDYARRFQQEQLNRQYEMLLRQQRYNELAGLSGTGQTANNLLASLGANIGGRQAGNVTGAGAAGAAGAIARGNTWADVLQYLAQMGRNYV